MNKRTREDKKRAAERRIVYLSRPVANTVQKQLRTEYTTIGSQADLAKSLVVSIVMFGLMFFIFRIWR